MNILVTGVNGFIGKHLITELISNDQNKVFGVSRVPTTISNTNYTEINVDLLSGNFTESFPTNIDVVIHLAQSNEYRNFPDGADDMFKINIQSTFLLLEWARKVQCKHFVFTSTGNVYKPSDTLLEETDECVPNSFYSASKYCAEQLVSQYKNYFKTTILRVFGVYGPNQQDKLIPNLIDSILKDKEITLVKGKGLFITLIYVSDCIAFMVKLINNSDHNLSEIYNIAGKEKLSIDYMANLIGKKLQKPIYTKITDGPIFYFLGSNNKISNATGYSSLITFEEGLELTIKTKSSEDLL
jgi:UDP-glucose 4-epimerase